MEILKLNFYNIYKNNTKLSIDISTSFNTFKTEKNLKAIKLYKLIFLISGLRPILKKISFRNIKKKIFKKIFIFVSLRKTLGLNFFTFFCFFYIYFYKIYYYKGLKYNFIEDSLLLYVDNIQFFLKNYQREKQSTKLKIKFSHLKPIFYLFK